MNQRQLATERLERAAEALSRSGWRVRSEVIVGAPLSGLLRVVARVEADLVVMGIRGLGGRIAGALGGVTEGVLSRCHAPVLVMP